MIRQTPRRAAGLFAIVLLAALAPAARAGSVLLSRDSDIRASGATPAGEYELSNGSGDFAPFADGLLSDATLPARSAAQQHSEPRVAEGGALTGATADGLARAAVDLQETDAFSDATTDFNIVFRVDGKPSLLTLDATLQAGGDATTGVMVRRDGDEGGQPLIALDVSEEVRTVRQSAELAPGTYAVSVWAFARGQQGESSASYAVSVALADSAGGTPVPLPAAVSAGVVGLSVVALVAARAREKTRKAV
jgi:hypothetical protein